MYNIDFRLPQNKFATSQAQKITTKGVNEWLEKLDYSNNSKAHHFFLTTLQKINRIELPVSIRMEVMELLNPVSAAILSEIIYKTSITNTSLDEKHLELSEQIQHLLVEISVGYKLIIKGILDDEKLLTRHLGDILPKACYNAIHSLSCLLIERYQNYLSEPPYIWFELNQIYLMAENLGIHDMELEDSQTIINEYIRISVIHISDPYRLMPFEIRKIYNLMENWAKYCSIEHIGKKHIKDYHIVGLTDKQGPNNAYANITMKKDDVRLFNLDKLKLHIKRKLEKDNDSDDDDDSENILPINARLDKEMLLRFNQNLSYTGSQKEKRVTSNAKIRLSIGMTACHYFVRGEKDFDPEKEIQTALTQKRKKTGRYESGESLNLSLVSLDDDLGQNTSRIARLRKINPFLSEDMLVDDNWDQINSSTAANAQVRSIHQTQTLDDLYREEIWEEKNNSDGGMLLLRSFQSSNTLHVGMLIAFKKNSADEKKYSLGLIRWLRINVNKGIAIGICYLSNQCEAVAVKALEGIGSGSDYNQAFLLKSSVERHSQNNQKSLLVPSGIYDINTILSLWYQGKENKVRITQKLLTTKTLMQVKFEAIIGEEGN